MRRKPSAKRLSRTIAISCIIVLSALPGLLVSAQGEPSDAKYFEETRQNVSGAFLRFFEERGGLEVFGYPLTREHTENGRRVQYFQRVRMEAHPENPDPYSVQLGLLGEELGYRTPPILAAQIPPANHPEKRYFPETGHTVSLAFLDFYENNGGLDIFGYPITEWTIEPSGRFVQYFQRGKMEWYPQNPLGERVQLGMLGTIYVARYVDQTYTKPDHPLASATARPSALSSSEPEAASAPDSVSEISILATVQEVLVGKDDKQVLHIYVFDQFDEGVPGASIELGIRYSDGKTDRPAAALTNANGYSRATFSVGALEPGDVAVVDLLARYGDSTVQTSITFLRWR